MNIFQFGKDDTGNFTKMRMVEKAYFNGYYIGGKFLEDVIFEISVKDNKPVAKATPDARDYLENILCSVEGWEKKVEEFLKEGYDDLFSEETDEDWYIDQLALGELSDLQNLGYTLV